MSYKNSDIKKVMKKKDLSASLESVKDRIFQSNYPREKLHFIKMDVRNQNDLRNIVEGNIIILRLDTDFYDSTLASLNSLYSKVVKNGFIIHDDYGHWKGSKKAVDEYFNLNQNFLWFHRIDYASRLYIKQ